MIKTINITLIAFIYSVLTMAMDDAPAYSNGPFVRLAADGDKTALQVARKTYKNGSLKVTLLSAAHFAQPAFYARHKEILDQASVVLYEGKGLDKKGFLFRQQPIIKKHEQVDNFAVLSKAFNLSLQLDSIDYQKSIFILADYSFDEEIKDPDALLSEISQFIEEKNKEYDKKAAEFGLADGFEYFVDSEIKKTKANVSLEKLSMELMKASKNSAEFLQQQWPEAFEKEYTKRNQIVLQKFAEQIPQLSAQATSHVVIYYGAAHMPYFEQELGKTYGLQLESEEWISVFSY